MQQRKLLRKGDTELAEECVGGLVRKLSHKI
jgi:hypothetical protein